MKILYVFNGQGLASGMSGGDARFIEITRRLKDKVEIHILTTIGGAATLKNESLNIPFIVVRAHLFKKKEDHRIDRIIAYIISIIASFSKINKLGKYDIIYSTSDFLCDVIPAYFYKKKNPEAKLIIMIHHRYHVPWKRPGALTSNFLGYASQQISFKIIKNCPDAIFLLKSSEGSAITDEFVRKGFSEKKIFTVENGIDYNFITKVMAPTIEYDACFVAGLRESKGVFDLIEIWNLVCKKEKKGKLLVVGSGEENLLKKLRDKIKKYGMEDNIILAGYIAEREELFKIMKSSRIFLSTSYEEGWGIAICEAMACSLPVIAWDLAVYSIYRGGIKTIPMGDVKMFANAILELLGNEQLQKSRRSKAYETVSKYDWNEIAEKELKIIEDLIKTKESTSKYGYRN